MFVIKVYRASEGDLDAYPSAYLDVTLDQAKAAASARLNGAQARVEETFRPQRARVYLLNTAGTDLLICELVATEHGAVELLGRPH